MAIGKISGPLLKENLLRDGVDLAFETDLIYLDVNNRRVGIKTSTPSHDLTVDGTIRTTNLEVTTGAVIGNITFLGDQISSSTPTLDLQTSGNVVYQNRLLINSLQVEGNAITNVNPADPDINITANGAGSINLNSDTLVNGNLHATGTITADGNITIGDANTDNVTFNADVASDILPDVDNLYQLGSASKRWKDVYVNTITASTVSAGSISVAGIDIALSQGNIYYVATNGNDNNSGIHQNDPLSSVGRALDLASAGDTIYIYPGVYQETLPLVVPVGVTVKGTSLRSVTIEPDSDVTVDMFLLNGETTIEDITIRGFEYDAITNTGYAFRFAPGFKVTTRSPYIRNVTVITAGSTVRLMTNPVDDPRGFLAGDAGKGVYLDGSIADPTSNEASCLFHSVTFICPGVDVLTAINGVRIEWLNCFTYFADRGLYLRSGNTGFAGNGKTRLKVYGISAQTLNVGDTISVENVSINPNTFTTGTIESFTYNSPYTNIIIDGKVSGFEQSLSPPDTSNQQIITFSGGQTASHLEWVDYSDFGAELRSIGSANVYGNYGAYGIGEGVLGYLVGQNFAYIGSGRLSDNDPIIIPNDSTNVNEVVQFDRAKIYYTSVDAQGNFKVGDFFKVDQATGEITFSGSNIAITAPTGIIFTDGINTTEITPTKVETGNIRISGNTIESTSLGITITAASNQINLLSDTTVENLTVSNNLTVNGNSSLGNTNSDTITVQASIASDIVPTQTSIYDLGSSTKYWRNVYLNSAQIDDINISGNVIKTTVSNLDLELRANGSGVVSVPSDNVDISQNLSVTGTTNLTDANISGTLIANNISTNNLLVSNTTTIINDIEISGNQIRTTVSNSDLEFTANGSGIISVPQNDVIVNQDLIVSGLTTLENVSVNGTITVNTFNTPNEITTNAYNTDDIRISGNVITTTLSNSNLELRANGTGFINIQDNAVVDNNLIVTGNAGIQGNLTVANTITATNLVSSTLSMTGALTIDDIEINGNVIRTTASNTNLELRTNGTGTVELENFSFNNNVITSTSGQDLEIVPSGTGVVKITSNQAIQIPVGSNAQRPALPQPGMIRFNNTINQYEGYNGTYWIQLGGVSDVDRNTYIIPESSPGANDNTIYFYTNGQLAASLNSSLFDVNKLRVDNVEIDGNVIRTTTTNTDLELKPNGTGVVVMDNFAIGNNTILNTTFGGVTEFQSTGTGYYRFGGNNAVVIPAGDNSARPLVGVVGMVRWNTAFGIMEAYDGSDWVSVAGTGAGINAAQAQDIALAIVLSLG